MRTANLQTHTHTTTQTHTHAHIACCLYTSWRASCYATHSCSDKKGRPRSYWEPRCHHRLITRSGKKEEEEEACVYLCVHVPVRVHLHFKLHRGQSVVNCQGTESQRHKSKSGRSFTARQLRFNARSAASFARFFSRGGVAPRARPRCRQPVLIKWQQLGRERGKKKVKR